MFLLLDLEECVLLKGVEKGRVLSFYMFMWCVVLLVEWMNNDCVYLCGLYFWWLIM